MPEEPIVIVEDTDIERKSVPVFKIAATTSAALLVLRTLRRRRLARMETWQAERMQQKVDNIMNRAHNPFAKVTPEDIIEGSCTEIKD